MKKYVTKQVEVLAQKWDGEQSTLEELTETGLHVYQFRTEDNGLISYVQVRTLDGALELLIGSWAVKYRNGWRILSDEQFTNNFEED